MKLGSHDGEKGKVFNWDHRIGVVCVGFSECGGHSLYKIGEGLVNLNNSTVIQTEYESQE